MPHLTAHIPESRLAGNEAPLITALTDAITDVYGDWARALVTIRLSGVPTGRFAHAGKPVTTTASVTLNVRAGLFDRPDATHITTRLGTALTDAVTSVLGHDLRPGTVVELLASPQERTFIGGVLPD